MTPTPPRGPGEPLDPGGTVDRTARHAPAVDRIEPLITELVHTAPAMDPAIVNALGDALRDVPLAFAQPLARSIARVVELVAARQIDSGIALPPLAMACATLVDGVRGTLTERELEAARFEIETLLPLPGKPPTIAAPDVPLSALRPRRP